MSQEQKKNKKTQKYKRNLLLFFYWYIYCYHELKYEKHMHSSRMPFLYGIFPCIAPTHQAKHKVIHKFWVCVNHIYIISFSFFLFFITYQTFINAYIFVWHSIEYKLLTKNTTASFIFSKIQHRVEHQ